ncbi:DUF4157 domain-containing protein [bacterium]|nr:DUF4157 domain-containing protein [bacterium]
MKTRAGQHQWLKHAKSIQPALQRASAVLPAPLSTSDGISKICSCEGDCPTCLPIPTKHVIGQEGDPYEKAADRTAQAVLSNPGNIKPKNSPTNRFMPASRYQGQGTSMAANERQYFEDRFRQDFSHIQIHRDDYARQLTAGLGARAFAYGNHLYFNNNVYSPFTAEGRRIIAHELAHTNQQTQAGQAKAQCWPASNHQTITKEVVNAHFAGQLSSDALLKLAFYAGQLDQRGCNYVYYAQDFILAKTPIIGPIIKSPSIPILSFFTAKLRNYEAPNHGEANLYKYPGTKTEENRQRMIEHLEKAKSMISKNGLTKQAMVYWGMALHAGQDRGSHQEGSKGKGHDRKKDDAGNPWNCDSPKDNSGGYIVAKNHTKTLISNMLRALSPTHLSALKTVNFGSLAGQPGPQVGTLPTPASPGIPKDHTSRRLMYLTIMKRMIYGKDDMPKRLFGMMPLMTKVGLSISGRHKKMLTVEPQIGLRVMKPTPLSYLDVFTGPAVGVGLDQKKGAFGWALSAQLGLIGEQDDLNLMLNQSWTTAGSTTVIGFGGTFDEVKLIEKIFGR